MLTTVNVDVKKKGRSLAFIQFSTMDKLAGEPCSGEMLHRTPMTPDFCRLGLLSHPYYGNAPQLVRLSRETISPLG